MSKIDLYQENEAFKEEIKRRGGNKSEIARIIGVSSQLLGQYERGRQIPKEDFFKKWKNAFKDDIKHLFQNDEDESSTFNEPIHKYEKDFSGIAILNLTESNKMLAESNRILAKNTEELIEMVRKTGNAPQDKIAAVDTRISDLLELIAEVGSGKKWSSKQEALAELSKFVHG